jgi:hypothetical protein
MRFFMPFLCGALALAPVIARAQQALPQAPASASAHATDAGASTEPSRAEGAEGASTEEAASSASRHGEERESSEPSVQLHGAVELAYGYNFNQPSNGITDWRWYDSRHNTLGLQNVLLETAWNAGPVKGHVQLQLGVFAELWWPGSRSPELDILWRLMQEVTVEWRTPHRPLSIEGGVFNVPFGPEYNVAYLNWNWSTSNLFALMPYQIGGFRANYDLGRGRRVRLGVYNGWDQIVADNNDAKSVMASFEWDDPDDELNYFYVNYMVGDERDFGDDRGPYARHTLDVYGQWHLIEKLSLRAHFFGGMAPTRGDTIEGWVGGALFARLDLTRWFSIAGRGDVVHTFSGPDGEDMFHADVLPDPSTATLMGSGTLTLDLHPNAHVSIRLEGRHDRANFPRFFSGRVMQTMPMMGMGAPQDIRTANNQTTVTLGMTAWF